MAGVRSAVDGERVHVCLPVGVPGEAVAACGFESGAANEPGDTLNIWKIDRLKRKLRDLIDTTTTTTAHSTFVFGTGGRKPKLTPP